MKKIVSLILLVILGINLSGCSPFWCPEPEILVKYKYLERPIPNLKEKPEFKKYDVIEVNFNGNDYMCMNRENAGIMSMNWLSYKEWSTNNFKILKYLKDSNTSK